MQRIERDHLHLYSNGEHRGTSAEIVRLLRLVDRRASVLDIARPTSSSYSFHRAQRFRKMSQSCAETFDDAGDEETLAQGERLRSDIDNLIVWDRHSGRG